MNNPYESPKSELLSEAEKRHQVHGFWKVFFWVHVILSPLIFIGMFFIDNLTILDWIDFVTFPIIMLGLYGYVFARKIKPHLFWKLMCFIFPLWYLFYEFVAPFILKTPQYGEAVEVDAWLLLSPVFGIPTFICFYLYAFKSNHIWFHQSG